MVILCLSLCACGRHEHSGAGVCERCGEMQAPELVSYINSAWSEIEQSGNDLIGALSGINDLSAEEQYNFYCKADVLSSDMNSRYAELIDRCMDVSELSGMVYQFCLLQNAVPSEIQDSSETAIENQRLQYQLYLGQLASSFSFISEYMKYLAGEGDIPLSEGYFEEQTDMPMPDRCIYGIEFVSRKTAPGNVQYTYSIGADEDTAFLNYNIYLLAVGMNDKLDVEITDDLVYVHKDNMMISAMGAGKDPQIGQYLTISFQA